MQPQPPLSPNAPNALWRHAAGSVAIVSAAFCIFVVTTLILSAIQERRQTPLSSPTILSLKQQLADRPNDPALKERIRQTDQTLRRSFFVQQIRLHQGAWLVLGGGAALILSLKGYWRLSATPPTMLADRVDVWKEARAARWGVGASAGVIAGVMLLWALLPPTPLPRPSTSDSPGTSAAPVWPAWEHRLANWPGFRGAAGDGVIRQQAPLPQHWDGPKGQNILWKTPVPLPGKSSPVVWGDRVFLTGADEKSREVFCYDAARGTLLWQKSVPLGLATLPEVFGDTGYAAPTPACDSSAVYAIFATGDLAAFDFQGKLLWRKSLGAPDSMYGFAASLLAAGGKVIVQWDMGDAHDAGKSSLLAFDALTGKPLWTTPRPVKASWSSPILARTPAGDRLILSGNPWVFSYDLATGMELWRANVMDGDVACSPVYRDGVVYLANERAKAVAIRDGGSGDVTKTHIAWTGDENLPDIVSPLCDGKSVLTVTGGGMLTCLDAVTGKKKWEHDLGTAVQASPMLVGDVVCLTVEDGITHRFRLGDAFEPLDTSPLGEKVSASAAAANGRLYLRGQNNLFCISDGR